MSQAPNSPEFIPSRFFFTSGVGVHKKQLIAFELALKKAKIDSCNLVKVSSVLPIGCKLIPREQGVKELGIGRISFAVYARSKVNEPKRRTAVAIGMATPETPDEPGYLSEVQDEEGYGMTPRQAGEEAEKLALEIMGIRLKAPLDDVDAEFKPGQGKYVMGEHVVRTEYRAEGASAPEDGSYATVVVAAVFLP